MMTKRLVRKTVSICAYIALAGFIAFWVLDRQPPALTVGTVAPLKTNLILSRQVQKSFASVLGKVNVINFWASYCPPCLKELPGFSRLAQKFRGSVRFIGAAVATNKDDMTAIKKQFAISYLMAQITNETAERWQAQVLPTTYIVDKSGKILWAHVGLVSETALEKALQTFIK